MIGFTYVQVRITPIGIIQVIIRSPVGMVKWL